MKSELIYTAQAIRNKIRHITAADAGRRVVVAAFIGRDALDFVSDPVGVEFYCWDQPSATDPESVADLMQDGSVWFVTGLHMKIYWSEHNGVLIGSPNLSQHALGESAALLEAAMYFDDSAAVDIRKIEARLLPHRRQAEDWLDELRRLSSIDPIARRGGQRPVRSLAEYFSLKNRAPWRVAFWNGKPSNHQRVDYEAVVGIGGIGDVSEARQRLGCSIVAPRGTATGDWLLQVPWPEGGVASGPVEWLNVSHVATVRGERRAYELTGTKRPAPFDCRERGFLPALKRFLRSHADDSDVGVNMNSRRLDLLAEEIGF